MFYEAMTFAEGDDYDYICERVNACIAFRSVPAYVYEAARCAGNVLLALDEIE